MRNRKVRVSVFTVVIAILFTTTSCSANHEGERKMENTDVKIEKFEKFVPKNDFDFNFKEAQSKGYSLSSDRITSEYLELQEKYRAALCLFLEKQLPLKDLDSELKAMHLTKVPKNDFSRVDSVESYYQSISYLSSDYLFLRNNIRIERLTKEDMEILKEFESNIDNEKMQDMVSRTYIEVLSVKFEGVEKENFNVIYSNGGKETVSNKTLVFWLYYQEDFDNSGNYIDKEKEKTNRELLDKLIMKYDVQFSEKLNCDVKIFVHLG